MWNRREVSRRYLTAFPQGSLAPNAWYWLGESYYVTQNFPIALDSFDSLLRQFPDSAKAPDALLKIGYCQIEMADVGRGQQTLNRVIDQYPEQRCRSPGGKPPARVEPRVALKLRGRDDAS